MDDRDGTVEKYGAVLSAVLKGALANQMNEKKANETMEDLIVELLELDNRSELSKLAEHCRKINNLYCFYMDMGCGSTSAVISGIYNDPEKGSAEKYELVTWQDRKPGEDKEDRKLSVVTMLGFDNSDKYGIGARMLEYGRVAENFKCLPTEQNLNQLYKIGRRGRLEKTARDVWKEFFNLAVSQMFQADMDDNVFHNRSRFNSLLIVAHPAGEDWHNKKILSDYKQLIADGTGFDKDKIITFSEGKAALSYVTKRPTRKAAIDWESGVIVIDIGASTIDIAFRRAAQEADCENPKKPEWSLNMAGKEVDALVGNAILKMLFPKEMEDYLCEKPMNAVKLPDEAFFDKFGKEITKRSGFPKTRGQFAFRMRCVKEELCNYGALKDTIDDKEHIFTSDWLVQLLTNEKISISCNREVAGILGAESGHRIVSGGSWYDYFGRLLRHVLSEINKQGKTSKLSIVVTGGSSNLRGIKEKVKECADVYGIKNIEVLNGAMDYERTVPFGSAYYFEPILRNLDEILQFPNQLSKKLTEQYLEVVSKCLSDELAPLIHSEMGGVIKEWMDLPKPEENWFVNDHSFKELEEMVRNHRFDQNEQNKAFAAAGEALKKEENIDIFFAPLKAMVNELLTKIAGTAFTSEFTYLKSVYQIRPHNLREFGWDQLAKTLDRYMNFWNLKSAEELNDDSVKIKKRNREKFYNNYTASRVNSDDNYLEFCDAFCKDIKNMLTSRESVAKEIERLTTDIVQKMQVDIMNALFMS